MPTWGLAVVFGSPGVSLAARELKIQRYSECQCKCFYNTHAEGTAVGVFTFFPQPNNTQCTFNAIDLYVPSKGQIGEVHPGIKFWDCKFVPGITAPAGPVKPPVAK